MFTKSFAETREFLLQVKEAARRVEMLESRLDFRRRAEMDTADLEAELEEAERDLTMKSIHVGDWIAKVSDVFLQWILTKRYVELLTWEEIAAEADMGVHNIHLYHGDALPAMQTVLAEGGEITLPDPSEDSFDGTEEDTGTYEDYLRYREEKKADAV